MRGLRGLVLIALVGIAALVLSGAGAQEKKDYSKVRWERYNGEITPGRWMKDLKITYEFEGREKKVPLQIYLPKNFRKGDPVRTLICLSSYRGSAREWEANSDITRHAETYRFVVVCPAMGTTLYEMNYYLETTGAWDSIPGGLWIGNVLVKYLRESFGIARERGRTAIAGISVGAHGAVLAAASYPDLFGAAGGLSGFYDNLAMTENKLLVAAYGPYKKFEKRWEDDNIVSLAASLRDTPVFIAHGMKDREYAFEQSRMLAIRLKQMEKKSPGKYRFEYVEKNYKMHNWDFWRQMVGPMMAYLDATLQK